MKRTVFLALTTLAASHGALSAGSLAQVAIIDRNTGVELVTHWFRGEYWVAGTPGARYAIEIRNRLGERLLAVTSVDGVNVVSGETAGWDQTGYVLDPHQEYEVTGWRKTDDEVAEFNFTASPNSYAVRTGRPANLGVIGLALFCERLPERVYTPPAVSSPSSTARAAPERGLEEAVTVPSPAPKAAAPSSAVQPSPPPPPREAAPKLGTGHGAREYSHVFHTDFIRRHAEPDEVVRIRYDSLENLIAMGIVERPHPGVPRADPFPSSPEPQYVPDPPGGGVGGLQ